MFLTPLGHIVVIGAPVFIAGTAAFLQQAYDEGWLSSQSGLRIATGFFVGGIITGALAWYCVTLPAIKRGAK